MPGYGTEQATLDQISGTAGIPTWPSAAAYANNVSMAEVLAYIQDAVRNGTGTGLATNESLVDVLYAANGIAAFPSAQAPANGVSIAEVLREVYAQGERTAIKSAATMVNAQTIFTISGGPIEIETLMSLCVTTNDGTASTLQYQSNPTVGSAATISGATTSLASVAAGASILLTPTALSTAPVIALAAAGGVQLGGNIANRIVVQEGTIKIVVGVGSTTGTWSHHIRFRPLARGVTVV